LEAAYSHRVIKKNEDNKKKGKKLCLRATNIITPEDEAWPLEMVGLLTAVLISKAR
jgi:hypothetical protein